MKNMMRFLAWLVIGLAVMSFAGAESALIIPPDVTTIEAEAFAGDMSLDEVVLPEGILSIGERAFADSSVRKINLPDSLTEIADNAFSGIAEIEVTASAGSYGYRWAVNHGYIGDSPTIENFTVQGDCGTDAYGTYQVSEGSYITFTVFAEDAELYRYRYGEHSDEQTIEFSDLNSDGKGYVNIYPPKNSFTGHTESYQFAYMVNGYWSEWTDEYYVYFKPGFVSTDMIRDDRTNRYHVPYGENAVFTFHMEGAQQYRYDLYNYSAIDSETPNPQSFIISDVDEFGNASASIPRPNYSEYGVLVGFTFYYYKDGEWSSGSRSYRVMYDPLPSNAMSVAADHPKDADDIYYIVPYGESITFTVYAKGAEKYKYGYKYSNNDQHFDVEFVPDDSGYGTITVECSDYSVDEYRDYVYAFGSMQYCVDGNWSDWLNIDDIHFMLPPISALSVAVNQEYDEEAEVYQVPYGENITFTLKAEGAEKYRYKSRNDEITECTATDEAGNTIVTIKNPVSLWASWGSSEWYKFSYCFNGTWTGWSEYYEVYFQPLPELDTPNVHLSTTELQIKDALTISIDPVDGLRSVEFELYKKLETGGNETITDEYVYSEPYSVTFEEGLFEEGIYYVGIRLNPQDYTQYRSKYVNSETIVVTGKRPDAPAITVDNSTPYVDETITFTFDSAGAEKYDCRFKKVNQTNWEYESYHEVRDEIQMTVHAGLYYGSYDLGPMEYIYQLRLYKNSEWTEWSNLIHVTWQNKGPTSVPDFQFKEHYLAGEYISITTESREDIFVQFYIYPENGYSIIYEKYFDDTDGGITFKAVDYPLENGTYEFKARVHKNNYLVVDADLGTFDISGVQPDAPIVTSESDYYNKDENLQFSVTAPEANAISWSKKSDYWATPHYEEETIVQTSGEETTTIEIDHGYSWTANERELTYRFMTRYGEQWSKPAYITVTVGPQRQ